MDEYDKKFAEMQKYIPFLEAMIERLQNVKDKSREIQLQKMQSLHGILSNSKRKLKIETLQRCEDVLQKLHNKVEKGNTPGLQLPHKKGEAHVVPSTASDEANADQLKSAVKPDQTEKMTEEKEIDETPASPTPPVSPDSGSQTAPIIIPTERSDFDDKSDSKPASPDQVDTLPTKAPIIIPTERTSNPIILSPSSKHGCCKNLDDISFTEWDMLEQYEKQNVKSKIGKLTRPGLLQKINDGRPHSSMSSRHGSSVPGPLDGSRRSSLILDKSRTGAPAEINTTDSALESAGATSDVKLKSPESDSLFSKHKASSTRAKDGHMKTGSKPSASLLLSPPPMSTEPPLSMEDLAELLNEEGDAKSDRKKSESKKESSKIDTNASVNKDIKNSKPFLLTQDDIDRENERRWEEVDKHIVKLTTRKCLPNISSTSSTKPDAGKSNEIKGPPIQQCNVTNLDNRNLPPSPSSKSEPRYADNYERHPRQLRDSHSYDNIKEKSNQNMHSRIPEDELSSPISVHLSSGNKSDDRSSAMYSRRSNLRPDMAPPRVETDFRMDGPDYFNRQMPNPGHWQSQLHGSMNSNEFCNSQWPPPPGNFSGISNPPVQPVPYNQHPMGMHKEMWNLGAPGSSIHMDSHPMNDGPMRANQFHPNMNSGIRPLMSPTARPPDLNIAPRPDNIRDDLPNINGPVIQPLMSPTGFGPVGSQYRNFQGETRLYEQSPFERGMEYPHVRPTWDSQSNRNPEVPYRGEGEVPCGIIGAEGPAGAAGSYSRPSTPCPWTRDRDRCSRGRGRDAYYNDRNRSESRSNFNRDSRRSEWSRESHSDWDNCPRFNRDNRSISDRDPRVRIEHQNSGQSRDGNGASARDPRLAKDKHSNSSKLKDTVPYNDRDPRKRTPFLPLPSRKAKDIAKSSKSSENHRRLDGESNNKHAQDKITKDKLLSPLESLYGVIDTKTMSGQGCLQKFKIPKIKRTEPCQPSSPIHCEQVKSSEKDIRSDDKASDMKTRKNDTDKDDTTAEVSSSSDGNTHQENWNGEDVTPEKKEDVKEEDSFPGSTQDIDKPNVKIGEADTATIGSPKSSSVTEKSDKEETEFEGPKSKDEVTQEWIEALIKSFEIGEGKKLVEQAKLIQKLGEVLQAKKLKKIKKIIESESESSNSSKEESIEIKRLCMKKKRRVIVSDSSDDECLADRLGILNTVANKDTKEEQQQEEQSSSVDNKNDVKKEMEVLSPGNEIEEESKKESIEQKPTISKTEGVSSEEQLTEDKTSTVTEENEDTPETQLEEAFKTETTDDSSIQKTPKAKARRRNSLEMLQEDIREMFICDGVVAATGHRMCRVQKEHNVAPATPPQASSAVVKKEETPSKRETEQSCDAEESEGTKPKKPARPRSTEESNRSKVKPNNELQRVTRQRVKRIVQSSDSEEDQPLALRTEIQNATVSNESETQNDEPSAGTLRRSKRFALPKDVKEPRVVVEKADVTKLDCSKVMFDSSSDESFGIDVSELAAAVDISLHPEKQSEPNITDRSEVNKKKRQNAGRTSKKKSKNLTNDEKVDDGASFTDDGSITSDISMSSSIASGKKMNIRGCRIDGTANEELLSNILVGLVPAKVDMEKSLDKGSDADVDDDVSDQLPAEQGNKRSSTRKKKKKCNWQMGIVSKRRRKKASLPKVDSDAFNSSVETDTTIKADSSSLLEEKREDLSSKDNEEVTQNDTKLILDEKGEDKKGKVRKDASNDEASDGKDKNGSSSSCNLMLDTSMKSASKSDLSEEVLGSDKMQIDKSDPKEALQQDEKQNTNESSSSEKPFEASGEESKESSENSIKSAENKKAEYDELIEKAFQSLNIKQLIDYAWSKHDKYKCLLCFFTGKNIVHHYKVSHPGKEILISRLKSADAQAAIQEAENIKSEIKAAEVSTQEICKFNCRFCYFSTEGSIQIAMEAFYEHCTTHTGEYRFRCNSCSYQAVAKSSMRTHYYKVCRKFSDTFNEGIKEDVIPQESSIYGYICSNCNYVQLNKCNLESHLVLWHSDNPDVKIVKINMSIDAVRDESTPEPVREKLKVESSEENAGKNQDSAVVSQDEESSQTDKNDCSPMDVEEVKDDKVLKTDKEAVFSTEPNLQKQEGNVTNETKHDAKNIPPTNEPDSVLPSEKLSVFLCPPELEHKEVQIQLERKKKMQEIIENIGIKLSKSASKKGLSIIDKLKDKMKTNLQESDAAVEELDFADDSSNKSSINVDPSTTSTENNAGTTTSVLNSEIIAIESSEEDPLACTETIPLTDEHSDNSVPIPEGKFTSDTAIESTSPPEKLDTKVRDPLTSIDDKKIDESEVETSDNDNTVDSAPIYDSDSSTEQSDAEPPADVNTLLKETSIINASSKDSMITTIQRLAAQLKASKHLESSENETHSRQTSPGPSIPEPPNVVPINSAKLLVGKLNMKAKETGETQDESEQPKNFIRLRRLSGDTLSVPEAPGSVQDNLLPLCDGNQSHTSNKTESVLQTDTEEECSFLKIENVVSLAPRADNEAAESPIINDIRKAVGTTPLKMKAGVSLLKKSKTPLILKRLSSVTITPPITKNVPIQPAPSDTVQIIPMKNVTATSTTVSKNSVTTSFVPITPKSKIIQLDTNKLTFPFTMNNTVISPVITKTVAVASSSTQSNVNYKIVKLPTVLKPKEMTGQANASKFKTVEAYNAMLDPLKLSQLYKCMSRNCNFTTDVTGIFHQHYIQHANEVEKKQTGPPYDYQKCAYCCGNFDDWTQLKLHIEEKHAHCRYQCTCCFYRAIVPSYVKVHQALVHAGLHGILLGKLIKEIPSKEDINRHDFVHPYVCQHDCGKFFYVSEVFAAHLKSKHASVLPIFKCHLCRATALKAAQLIAHYKMHGFYKYQCLYCLNGSDTFSEMHSHMSSFHCNRLPQILERTLPSKPTRNKDVIEQLLIRTLDENVKYSDITEIGSSGKMSNKSPIRNIISAANSPLHKIIYPQLPKEITVIDKDESGASDKPVRNFISVTDSLVKSSSATLIGTDDNSKKSVSSAISDVTVTTSSNKLSLELNCENSDKSISMLFSDKPAIEKEIKGLSERSIFRESQLDLSSYISNDANAMDPLDSSELNCTDEFININILDNPDFLKGVSSRSIDSSFHNIMASTSGNKTEDSDIEILESIEPSETKVKKTESLFSNNKKEDIITNNKAKPQSSTQNTEEKEELKFLNNTENSDASNDNSNNANTSTNSDKPLTLEDIKDTGFTGTQLYKCGFESCTHGAQTAALLKAHTKECKLRGESTNLNCAHCNKRFVKVGFLLEHLKAHGLKRFGCSLCKMRCTVACQAMTHMKTKHKFANSKLVPADPKNPSADGLFVVQPILSNVERKGKKRKSGKPSEKETEKVTDMEKLSFSPDEIESLPRQAIYNREVQCAMCPYTTKVRTNIIRHLQLHAKDESVPESGPVNPVPCLDKKERMFDKMVNLASSSHQNGRMGGKSKEPNKDSDEDFIPKFVPEHKRYVCGVAECNYLTVDEAMLRYHLKALHSEEPYFRCPHCPPLLSGQEGMNIAIDKMGVHLKMHDTRLYKCSHCNHHHYHRHVVERHLSDKHPEKRPFVKVIRELESTENSQQPVQEEAEEEVPDPDGNHWKCNICDYKCVYKAEMINHASTTHDEKSQFKCTLCTFKTSGKIMFEQHINSKHSNDPNVDYVMIYQRIKGINKKNTDNIEQNSQDEPFDTTPLWRRDMPRIRHIRGILLEEDENPVAETSARGAKRKSDAEVVPTKPAKIKPGKSASLDENKQLKEKSKRSLSCEKIETENSNEPSEKRSDQTNVPEKSAKEHKTAINGNGDEPDVGRFGPYGKPDGNMYVCTLCTQFKSKYKHDMRDHLYRELNYARWHCKECGYLSVNRNALLRHFNKHHPGDRPDHEPLSPDDTIEDWVRTLLKRQTCIMRGIPYKPNPTPTTKPTASTSSSVATTEAVKTSPQKIGQTASEKTYKTVDLTRTLSNTSAQEADPEMDAQDDDSGDNEALIIDVKDDVPLKKEKEKESSGTAKGAVGTKDGESGKPLTCKHCKMIFTRWRGFKLHVQLTHLKRLGYLCPYCDRSTNSETLMRQHIRSKHRGCVEKIIHNPDAGGPELTSDFWEKEYGVVAPKKLPKKRKRMSGEDGPDKDELTDTQEKCSLCGFTAMNFTGLKAHMRIHTTKNNLKCNYCTFATSVKAELWEHWEVNHAYLPFKFENTLSTTTAETPTDSATAPQEKYSIEDYSDDIEEEQVVSISDTKSDLMYCCFYCSFRGRSLDIVRTHWSLAHKENKLVTDAANVKPGLPFRYSEMRVPLPSPQKIAKTTTLFNKDVEISHELCRPSPQTETQEKSNEDGWICQWCSELCDSENKMKSHHNMFHSHLPVNFKKQGSNEAPKGYACPECTFTTTLINVMKSHVAKHINLFKCKYCDKTFDTPTQVSSHNTVDHPDLELKIESIPNYELLVEKLMARVKWHKTGELSTSTDQADPIVIETSKSNAVAKKSTTKSSIGLQPIHCKMKAVARKSTNPLPRCPPNFNFKVNENDKSSQKPINSKQFSYYGMPKTPVNLAKLNTYMVVGGHRMKVNCTTLAQLININPQVILKDLKHDAENVAVLAKLK